ncbi:MAG: DUF2306 domain-containing protein [Cognatishimia sp.]|uniref:DUF2306 domain-containing protein n=1 Tax=Cognatishimia sp. TaxID=2211648 RepID=UPI003B8BBEB8
MSASKFQTETSWSLILLWTLSVLVSVVSLRFLVAELAIVMPHMMHHAMARPLSLYLHIGLAPVALALLPVQFSARIRTTRPAVHRWGGRIYAIAILISGTSGIFLALGTEAGPVAAAGFAGLAVLWLATTARAVQLAMQRRIALHREWMIRSAALTLAAVTLRLYVPFGQMAVGFELAYVAISWLCWVPNLFIAEWFLRRRSRTQPA